MIQSLCCSFEMNVRINIKSYLEMWGNERDWDRVEIVTLAHTTTSPYLTICMAKILCLCNQNPRKNLHLHGKFKLSRNTYQLLNNFIIWNFIWYNMLFIFNTTYSRVFKWYLYAAAMNSCLIDGSSSSALVNLTCDLAARSSSSIFTNRVVFGRLWARETRIPGTNREIFRMKI